MNDAQERRLKCQHPESIIGFIVFEVKRWSRSKDGRDERSAKETLERSLTIASIAHYNTKQKCDQIPKCHVIVTQSL